MLTDLESQCLRFLEHTLNTGEITGIGVLIRDLEAKRDAGGDLARRLKVDRPWWGYPIGTRAYAYNGGHWTRVSGGWRWMNGACVFPTPGGDALGDCIELPVGLSETPIP